MLEKQVDDQTECPTCDGSGTSGHEADCPSPQEDNEIVAFMEHHEDDWDEVAFNGFGTAHIARMGNLTYGLTEWGDFVGERWDTEDDAKEAVRATAAGWIANCDEASHQILGDPATLQELRDKLVGDLNHEGFEIGWDCLGGDWWGITVVNDVSMVIITGGDGGNGARLGDKAEHIGMGFYHEGGWIADMPEAPTDWAEFVKAIRSWIIEGTLPEEVKS